MRFWFDFFHFYFRLGAVLVLFFVAERAERCRGARFRVRRGYAVVRGAVLGTVRVRREQALSRLARAVAHFRLRRCFRFVYLHGLVVRVPVRVGI